MFHAGQKSSGDFPAVLYEVISKRSSVIESSLSVDGLNQILDDLAQNMGKQYVIDALRGLHLH
jgi:DNA ligase-4